MLRTEGERDVNGAATDASLGETYALEPYAWAGRREPAGLEGRFSHVLTRARSTGGATALLDIIDAPFPLGPSRARAVYALHVDDDLGFDAAEFADGLAAVLSEAAGNLFASKRICALGTPAGHLTLGRDYLKVVERGREVRRVALPDEARGAADAAPRAAGVPRDRAEDRDRGQPPRTQALALRSDQWQSCRPTHHKTRPW